MIKNSFIYATLAAGLLCGTINSPVQAIRWDELTNVERTVCRKIHEEFRDLDRAVEAVSIASQALGSAGTKWNTKMPATIEAVRGLRALIVENAGETQHADQDLPHFTVEGRNFLNECESAVSKINALFNDKHMPIIGYPKLGLLAQATAAIRGTFHAFLTPVPGLRDDRNPALLYGFLIDGYEEDLPEDRRHLLEDELPVRADDFGPYAARPAAAAAAAAAALPRYNPRDHLEHPLLNRQYGGNRQPAFNYLLDDFDDGLSPAARAARATARVGAPLDGPAINDFYPGGEEDLHFHAARPPLGAPGVDHPDEVDVYLDSIMGDEAAYAAYFDANQEERVLIRAAKAQERAQEAQDFIARRGREAAQRLRIADATPGEPARRYTLQEQRQVAQCIAAQKAAKGEGESSGTEMAAAVSRAMPDLADREIDDLLFAQGIYPIRDAHEPAARLFGALVQLGMDGDEIYRIMAEQSVAAAEIDVRYVYPHRRDIIESLKLLRDSPYQLNIERLQKTVRVMVDLEEEENDRY